MDVQYRSGRVLIIYCVKGAVPQASSFKLRLRTELNQDFGNALILKETRILGNIYGRTSIIISSIVLWFHLSDGILLLRSAMDHYS